MSDVMDELEIRIEAKAQSANTAIDALCKKIDKLSGALNNLEIGDINKLASGIENLGSSAKNAESLKKVASALDTLSNVSSGNLKSLATSIPTLTNALNGLNSLSFNSAGLDSVAETLRTFGYKTSTAGTQNLGKLKTDLVDFINGINSAGAVNFDFSGLENLLSNLSRLGSKSVTQAVSNLQPLKQQLMEFMNDLNGMGGLNFDVSGVTTLVTDISKLGGKPVTNAITNLPLLSSELSSLMTTLSKAPTVSQNVIDMTSALANLAAQGSKVGSASNSIVNGLNRTNTAATKASKSVTSLAAAFGKFYASYFLVIRGFKKLWEGIESSMDYIETSNYFEVSLSQISKQFERYGYESAEAYGEALENGLSNLNAKLSGYTLGSSGEALFSGDVGLGMDIESMMNFQAKTLAVTNSVGMLGNASVETTKALSMLAGDLSSLTNLDVSSVMDSLSSGLIGQSRALYKYGIDITNNTLQQYALAEGIDKAVSEMTQSEKMQLRLLAILDQSQVAWGDLGNTVNSVANQYRVFEQQIGNLGRTLGNLFLPIVKNVLPYVNGLIIALNNLFTTLGFDLWGDTWLEDLQDGISGGVVDGLEDIEDAADDAIESVNELIKGVRGFDVLNVITSGSSTTGSTLDELEGTIDLTQSITEAVANYETAWNKAFENAENKASEFADNLSKNLEPIKKIFEDIKIGDWFAVGEDVSGLVTDIFDFFSKAIDDTDWAEIGKKIGEFLNGVDWEDVFTSAINLYLQFKEAVYDFLISAIDETDWEEIGEEIGSALKNVDWEDALNKLGEFVWKAINASIKLWGSSFDTAPIETTIVTAIALMSFTNLSLPKLLTGIESAVALAVSGGISIPEILLTIGNFSFSTPVGAEIGLKLLDELEEWIRENFGEKVLGAMGETLTLAVTTAGGFVLAGPAGALVGAIIGLLIDGFSTDGYSRKVLNSIAENVFNFDDAKYFFDTMKQNFTDALNGSNVFEIGGNIVEGILNGMLGVLVGFAEPFVDLFDWVVDGICELFGIHSPAKEMEFIGENIILGIAEGFTAGFKALKEKFKSLWNDIADFLNEKMTFEIDPITIMGTTVFKGATIDLGVIPKFENGGYVTLNTPSQYSLIMAGENGNAELIGSVGGRTAVAGGAEITGISDTIRATSSEEVALLKQQNALLQAILEKEFGISQNDIGRAAQNYARDYSRRTGREAYSF